MQQSQSLVSRYKWPLILAVLLLVSLPLEAMFALAQYDSTPGHAFVTPATSSFNITNTGNYTLWSSNQETVAGQLVKYPPDVPSTLKVTLTRDADNAEIPLLPAMNKTVTIGSKKRTAYLVANLHQSGKYTITTEGSAEPRVFYFSRDFILKMVLAILFTACSSFVLFVGMIASAVYAMAKQPVVTQNAPPSNDLPAPERVV